MNKLRRTHIDEARKLIERYKGNAIHHEEGYGFHWGCGRQGGGYFDTLAQCREDIDCDIAQDAEFYGSAANSPAMQQLMDESDERAGLQRPPRYVQSGALTMNSQPQSYIGVSAGGTSFNGPKAVDLYRATSLWSSMNLFKAGLRFRGLSGPQALKLATGYTGKKYKRGQYDEARADMRVYLDAQRGTLPVVQEKGPVVLTDGE